MFFCFNYYIRRNHSLIILDLSWYNKKWINKKSPTRSGTVVKWLRHIALPYSMRTFTENSPWPHGNRKSLQPSGPFPRKRFKRRRRAGNSFLGKQNFFWLKTRSLHILMIAIQIHYLYSSIQSDYEIHFLDLL